MLNIGTAASIEAVVRAAGATKPADQRQVIAIVHRCLGIAEKPAACNKPAVVMLTIRDAAECLARKPRTIRQYVKDGLLEGVHVGQTGRLIGIPAREIDGFLARFAGRKPSQEAPA